MLRKEYLVSGKVQRVGFRFFCKYQADLLFLTGYAKNLDDGKVLIEVQGEEEALRKFKSQLLKGNGFCRVTNIEEKELNLNTGERRFSTY